MIGKGAGLLTSVIQILTGEASAFLFRFIRTMLFARLTTVEDFGVAALFALIVAGITSLSEFGLPQLMVQRKEGDEGPFQAAIQGLSAARGVVSGLVLFAAAGPLAGFFGAPDAEGALRALAGAMAVLGLLHFDVHRFQRQRRFLPFALTFSAPVLVSTAMIWPLYLWFGDFRAMAAALVLEMLLTVAASHLLAERRYHLRLDRSAAAVGFRFGWPLLFNALALFLVMQGEKIVVARELGPAVFGLFAMGLTLAISPGLLLSRAARTLLLPRLSAVRDAPERFARLGGATVETNLFNGVVTAGAVTGLGPIFIMLAFGEKFAALIPLLPFFGLVALTQLGKAGPATISVALGRTTNPLIGNLGRIAALPLAWWAAASGYGLNVVLAIAAAGEAAGLALAFATLRLRAGFDLRLAARGLVCWAAMAAPLLLAAAGAPGFAPPTDPLRALVWLALPPLLCLLLMANMRGFVFRTLLRRGG